MQANWSLILNILLLIGVIIMIGRLIKTRRQHSIPKSYQPSLGQEEKSFDDIIAVRQVNCAVQNESADEPEDIIVKTSTIKTPTTEVDPTAKKKQPSLSNEESNSLMMFLLAKDNQQLAGYELLQTVLSAGLRFGEGQLFHRHQHLNGQGPVLCSLAAATASGAFDLQNIGAFSVRGLCLFMHASGNTTIDAERFAIMHTTAKQLSEDLNTHLLDDKKQPLSEASLVRYNRMLGISESPSMA